MGRCEVVALIVDHIVGVIVEAYDDEGAVLWVKSQRRPERRRVQRSHW